MPSKTPFSTTLRDPSLLTSSALINGSWIKAGGGASFPVCNPATGELLAELPDLSRQQVADAIVSQASHSSCEPHNADSACCSKSAAKAAQPAWAARTAYERQACLYRLLAEMRRHADDLALILTLENGKPLAEAKGEIHYGAGFVEWFAGEAVRTYGHNVPSALPGTRNNVIRQPIGVCGLITPWWVA